MRNYTLALMFLLTLISLLLAGLYRSQIDYYRLAYKAEVEKPVRVQIRRDSKTGKLFLLINNYQPLEITKACSVRT